MVVCTGRGKYLVLEGWKPLKPMHTRLSSYFWLAFLVLFTLAFQHIGSAGAGEDPAPIGGDELSRLDVRYQSEVLPFLKQYCLDCHSELKPEGDLDLSSYATAERVVQDLARWEGVLEQLEEGRMPPARAKAQPAVESRNAIASWIKAAGKFESDRNAGDPGQVLARRLSNAEFDNTIRDLTGVDIRPTRAFPVDPANGAGFDNSSESLAMSPALARKYLDAARGVAEHLVFKQDGLGFATHPMMADTDRDKYCVKSIIDFYKQQKTDIADFFLAAWKYRHRVTLGRSEDSLDSFAKNEGLSTGYLSRIWEVLQRDMPAAGSTPTSYGPLAALRVLWDDLPAPGAMQPVEIRAGCERMRDFVLDVRGQLVPEVKNLSAPHMGESTQPFILWKNRQFVANRRRYAGGVPSLHVERLKLPGHAATQMVLPDTLKNDANHQSTYEKALFQFCDVFPDAFYVSERARVHMGTKGEKGNAGRLLSAGFHSMTGYFRDDAPLSDLILDDSGRAELNRLWRNFNSITGAPTRQYSSFLWFERAETGFLNRDKALEFVRAEDKDAASPEKMRRFADLYLKLARSSGAGEVPLKAIEDQFQIFATEIQQAEDDRRQSEPRQLDSLLELAGRAYRRPLRPDERQGILTFYHDLRTTEGLEHEDAVRDTFASILLSPHFCYRVDRPVEVPGGGLVRSLTGYDLASRLSYFLWASMPDAELLSHAEAGDLHQPEVLTAQARRMLKDGRVRGLATEFGGNWLDFRRFEEHKSVDRQRFPAFDDDLRKAMFEEPIRFLIDLIQNDRPIQLLISGKHTFVNPTLAKYYGMPIPDGGVDVWTRVDQAADFGRGGLLPMAVFLTRNSPGLRTSPVKRGYWVARRLLGEKIPAPPANVPDLPDDESKLGDLTLREVLARHRADAACAGCHERFDSIGLAFEGYGPVGEVRKNDLGGRPVDTHAAYPRGGEGTGVEGLQAYLLTMRGEEFSDNLCRKLLAYALGRSLLPSDNALLQAMRERLEMGPEPGRFMALVEAIVTSPQFLCKRTGDDQDLAQVSDSQSRTATPTKPSK